MGKCFELLQPTLFVEVNTCDYRELGKYVLILFGKSVQFCSSVNEFNI